MLLGDTFRQIGKMKHITPELCFNNKKLVSAIMRPDLTL